MEAGPNAATRLSELASVCPGFEGLDSSWVQLLSHQAVLSHPEPVAAVMLQRTLPERHLTAHEVGHSKGKENAVHNTQWMANAVPKTSERDTYSPTPSCMSYLNSIRHKLIIQFVVVLSW